MVCGFESRCCHLITISLVIGFCCSECKITLDSNRSYWLLELFYTCFALKLIVNTVAMLAIFAYPSKKQKLGAGTEFFKPFIKIRGGCTSVIIVNNKSQLSGPMLYKRNMNRFGEKVFTYQLTNTPTYWQWWFHRIPFRLKPGTHNQIWTSNTFWDKVSKTSLGMPDHAHLNLHDQFVALIDMKFHAQNQFYTSFSFWDLKGLIASLGMPGHFWPNSCKITSFICSYNRYVPACQKSTLYLQ